MQPGRRRYLATTDSDHDEPAFPDHTGEREVDGPNSLSVADLTLTAHQGIDSSGNLVDHTLCMNHARDARHSMHGGR